MTSAVINLSILAVGYISKSIISLAAKLVKVLCEPTTTKRMGEKNDGFEVCCL